MPPDRRIHVVRVCKKFSVKSEGLSLNRPYFVSSLLFTFMEVIF